MEYVAYYHALGLSYRSLCFADDYLIDILFEHGEGSECVWLIPTWEAFERASDV